MLSFGFSRTGDFALRRSRDDRLAFSGPPIVTQGVAFPDCPRRIRRLRLGEPSPECSDPEYHEPEASQRTPEQSADSWNHPGLSNCTGLSAGHCPHERWTEMAPRVQGGD